MRLMMVAATLWVAGSAQADLLVNGDLELPGTGNNEIATGWTLDEPDVDVFLDPVNSATFESFANHTPAGERGLWFRSFEGGLDDEAPDSVNAHLYQEVTGVAGVEYTLSAWFRLEPNYSGLDPATPTQTLLVLQFRDGIGDILFGIDLSIELGYTPDNTWQLFTIIASAPVGTETIRVGASFLEGVIADANPQSAFVDDFTLVPAPGAFAWLAFAGWTMRTRRRRTA